MQVSDELLRGNWVNDRKDASQTPVSSGAEFQPSNRVGLNGRAANHTGPNSASEVLGSDLVFSGEI